MCPEEVKDPPVVDPANPVDDAEKKDSVKYETHKKLLDEKKKKDQELADTKLKLAALETEKSEREKKEAEEKGDLKKLLELERAEKKKATDRLSSIEGQLKQGAKLRAVLDSIPGKVDEAYWDLIDVEKIVVDPESGQPDELSVKAAAKAFEVKHARLIDKPGKVDLPNDAAKAGGSKLTYDAWTKLPPKEQKERLSEALANDAS